MRDRVLGDATGGRRRLRGVCGVAVALVALGAWPATAAPAGVAREDADVEVVNPTTGETHRLDGYRVGPRACTPDTAVLLLHGLSYTGEAWDVPGYAYARIIAAAGYDVHVVDRLGYGGSELADGRDVTTTGHADMAAQMVRQLAERYDDVVLGGHSAGAETAISAVGLQGAPVSGLVAMGYHTYAGAEFLARDWSQDQLRAVADDYVYFLGTPERRAELFYTRDNADPEVIAADNAAAVLTPSGEIQTITLQPARIGSALVEVPTLLQLGEDDPLFPVEFAPLWQAQFVSAASVSTDVVPGSAHTYMLHHAGPAAAERITRWLAGPAGLAGCSMATTTAPTQADGAAAPLPATGTGTGGLAAAALLGAVLLHRRRTSSRAGVAPDP